MNGPPERTKERLERVINFRISTSAAQQIEALMLAGEIPRAKSADQAARSILIDALAERSMQHELKRFAVDNVQPYELFRGDALTVLRHLPGAMFDCCITSPPYFRARNYRHSLQIGQERTPEEFIDKLVDIF